MHSTTRRTPSFKHLGAVVALAGLAACGGGGDDRATYALGGSVSGLATGQSVVLASGGDEATVAANGGFAFARPWVDGSAYAVAVKTAPAGAGCVVRHGSGTVAGAAVNTVAVRCAPLATLADGPWEQDRCQPSASGGVRSLWNFATPANGPLTVGVGTVAYGNAQCDGVGVAAPGALSATFWFQQERTEAGGGLAAFWGKRQTFPGGLLNPAVFTPVALVRKGNYLCLLEDTATPSAYPNAASLEAAVGVAVAAGQCYTPR
jgi:hypothetical protein